MAVNVQVNPIATQNRYMLLAWLNECLQTRFTKVEHTCSGAPFCQLMHWLFPDSVDLKRVRFQSQGELDALHNFSVLQASFRKSGVIKVSNNQQVPVKDLIQGNAAVGLGFLQWFKLFFDSNHNGLEYDALQARAGQSMLCANDDKLPERSNGPTQQHFCKIPPDVFFRHEITRKHPWMVRLLSLMQLIQQHWPSPAKHGKEMPLDNLARHILGKKYPQDIVRACSHTPYCLYLYRGLELGREVKQTASMLLVGYFDLGSGVRKVRLLDTLLHGDCTRSDSVDELDALVETLGRFEIPIANLAMFYCQSADCNDLGLCQLLVSGLRALNPGLVSLCGLPGLAGRACHAGVTLLPETVLELVRKIHHHYSTCSTTNDNLKEMFAYVPSLNPLLPLSSQVLFLGRMVQNMTDAWPNLLQYFESRGSEGDSESVCVLLRDLKVRLSLLFTGHALEPLFAFQDLLEQDSSDMSTILLQASSLVHSYAASFLQAPAVDQFLRRRDSGFLANSKDYLQGLEVNLGAGVEDFLSEHRAELKDDAVDSFLESSVSFYKAITWSLIEGLPLPSVLLKHIPSLLWPAGRLEVTGRSVVELGTVMGLCGVPVDTDLLTDEFLDYMISQAEEPRPNSRSVGTMVEQHWSPLLRTMGKRSILRKLILSLLALPSGSLQRDMIFAQYNYSSSFSLILPYFCCTMSETKTSQTSDIIDLDDSDDDVIWTVTTRNKVDFLLLLLHLFSFNGAVKDGKGYTVGELVWGKVEGYSLWPGIVQPWKREQPAVGIRKVEWFGDGMFSEIQCQELLPFGAFAQYFCPNSFATLVTYRDAIFQSLQLVASRCRKVFSLGSDEREEHLRVMLDWAFGGFKPTGPDGFKPPLQTEDLAYKPPVKKQRQQSNKNKDPDYVYVQPDQKYRGGHPVLRKRYVLTYCLCCMTDEVEIFHPLFEGSLCLECKDNFTETLYRYDEDGYQSYCTVCCAGLEVILCGNDSCCRSFCLDCLDILVGPGTFDSLKEIDPWICYLCQPHNSYGSLKPRMDWSIRVQGFFANDSAFQFEPHRVYPSIPANMRRPIKVLSLFDGIGTGYLVLKELGFKVDKYVASEICSDSIAVSEVNHEGKIIHMDDVRLITKEHIQKWGPFDLLIGGSPCNDLSIVNPARKGLFEGTGRLFFEYYRLLHIMKPKEEDPRPFFWMFENVVFMNRHDKANICRFLECNPVLVDAVKVSPAHRARYFWGNIPGMNRPIIASQNDKVNLQDCLESGRVAKFTKVRTITTNPNSLKQGKDVRKLPVSQKGNDDNLWITEIEKIFGFPKHYTDVKNMNRQQRQKVLGKSWSVPVIRHLFAPLKDYFACEQFPTSSSSAIDMEAASVIGNSWCSPIE
uniref:DNA (cytosine-5-)-methyltransferase n=1 Tax=Esox lucius TaxID=8010 RepID=A0A6Q2XHE0_ESOLU